MIDGHPEPKWSDHCRLKVVVESVSDDYNLLVLMPCVITHRLPTCFTLSQAIHNRDMLGNIPGAAAAQLFCAHNFSTCKARRSGRTAVRCSRGSQSNSLLCSGRFY